ncbi:AAA family ATPase [Chroococcidiopsis sp.]|uniref:AAA family ATPase n=1 Tax=Chroococcidiopsis sp. TaxID=3088168 RepID=UPI003F3E6DF6
MCAPTYSLILLVGLPGSGKSTLVGQLVAADPKLQLISTDKIRERLFGNEVIQGEWLLVWREVQRQFQRATIQISRGEVSTAIYDATNAQRRHRREVIVYARAAGFKQIVGLWVDTPVWLCLARNRRRDRQVPEEVILRMHRQLRDAPPSLSEGLDCLLRSSQLFVCTSTTLPQ